MRIAAVQDTPVYLNRVATTERVVQRITEAGAGGADLIAFPEVFISGYPNWLDRTNGSAWEDHSNRRPSPAIWTKLLT